MRYLITFILVGIIGGAYYMLYHAARDVKYDIESRPVRAQGGVTPADMEAAYRAALACSVQECVSPAQATYTQAVGLFKKGKHEVALKDFVTLAAQGMAKAQYNIAIMYYDGVVFPQDFAQAARWYELAAIQNIIAAQFNLGAMYHQGIGVAQDYAQALTLYQKAAQQGHAEAQANLAHLYYTGDMGAPDYMRAYYWMHRAVAQELEGAQKNLALIAEHLTPEQIETAKQSIAP